MNLIIRNVMLTISLLAFSPLAISNDVYNIHEFKVHGVSLGDSAEQVIEGLIDYYSIVRDDLEIEKNTALGLKPLSIAYVDYDTDGVAVSTYIHSKIDPETKLEGDGPRVLDAMRVSWRPANENYKAYAKKVIDKYGKPTFSSTRSYTWCEELNTEKTECDKEHAKLTITKM